MKVFLFLKCQYRQQVDTSILCFKWWSVGYKVKHANAPPAEYRRHTGSDAAESARVLEYGNANRWTYRLLPGLMSFLRLMGSSLYPPRLFAGMACLGPAYRLSAGVIYQWPGPLVTLCNHDERHSMNLRQHQHPLTPLPLTQRDMEEPLC